MILATILMGTAGGGEPPEGSVETCMHYGRPGSKGQTGTGEEFRTRRHTLASQGAGGSKTTAASHRRPFDFIDPRRTGLEVEECVALVRCVSKGTVTAPQACCGSQRDEKAAPVVNTRTRNFRCLLHM